MSETALQGTPDLPNLIWSQFRLSLSVEAYRKLMAWVFQAGGLETSGVAEVELEGLRFPFARIPEKEMDLTIHIKDAWNLATSSSTGLTNIAPERMAKFLFEEKRNPAAIKVWWH